MTENTARPAKCCVTSVVSANASEQISVKRTPVSVRNIFLIYVRDKAYFRLLDEYSVEKARIKVAAFPPLGIQTLAPVLRRAGHRVRLFDTCHPDMRTDQIAAAIEEERPDVVALSFLSVTAYPAMKKLAERLKSSSPWVKIIAGGVFASMNADRILEECLYIDCVGVGEGEELLQDYLANLDNAGAVDGLVWRNSGEVVLNKPRPLIEDLDQYPYPDRTSLPIDYIESLPLDVPAILSFDNFCTIQTSRGCPYKCIYCDIPNISQGRWRYRSAAHVLGEMQQLHDAGYRSLYLTDDHFLMNSKRINEICTGIIERKLAFRWGCEGRVDSVAVEQMPIMSKANCDMLAFGVESGTQKVLTRLGKGQTIKQIEHAIGQAKKHGINRVHGFFVIGSPNETADDIMKTFSFAARLQLDTFGFNRLTVYRGTPLWREYVNSGIIDDKVDWYKSFKCADIDPDVLSGKVVNSLRMQGYARLLAYRAIMRPLKTWQLLRTFSRHMKKSDMLKLILSPFYWKKVVVKPELPASFALAVKSCTVRIVGSPNFRQ
ncbi:MAG: B12-binding domain-containing radical SAM protein [Dissulfurispiraceae bacterium]